MPSRIDDLKEKYGPWAVVTGASAGIGKAMAELLARHGIDLVLVARREDLLQDIASRLQRDAGIACRVIAVDLTDETASEAIDRKTGDLDVGLLVAAAGFGTSGPFSSSDLETERSMFSVNCAAVTDMAHRFARRFIERQSGGIVLMSSVVAFQGVPLSAHYAATKAYIQTLGEGLHSELAKQNVDVVCSAPGPVDTGFAERANLVMANAASPKTVAEATLKALGKRRTVRPGLLARVLAAALAVPRWGRILIMTQVMAGMTRHQRKTSAASRGA